MFVTKCRKTVYTNKKWNDEIEWFSYGTGGRKMKVMSKVIALDGIAGEICWRIII